MKLRNSENINLVPYMLCSLIHVKPLKSFKAGNMIGDKLPVAKYSGDDIIMNFITDTLKTMVIHNIPSLTMFAHNFRGHDGILIIKTFAEIHKRVGFKVQLVIHENKVYSVTISYEEDGKIYKLIFQCRLLLLKHGLGKLRDTFGLKNKKLYMPHRAITSLRDLDKRLHHLLVYEITDEERDSLVDT